MLAQIPAWIWSMQARAGSTFVLLSCHKQNCMHIRMVIYVCSYLCVVIGVCLYVCVCVVICVCLYVCMCVYMYVCIVCV